MFNNMPQGPQNPGVQPTSYAGINQTCAYANGKPVYGMWYADGRYWYGVNPDIIVSCGLFSYSRAQANWYSYMQLVYFM